MPRVYPSLEEIQTAYRDVLGEAAMRQPNGASYKDFADAILPLRYTDGAFRCYPIVLGVPAGEVKARLISDGSSLNGRGNSANWLDTAIPVAFSLEDGERFGQDLACLTGPHYIEGSLPVVQMTYKQGEKAYHEEVFAGVESPFTESGVCFVGFQLATGELGHIRATIESEAVMLAAPGLLVNTEGKALVWFGDEWQWEPTERTLSVELDKNRQASLAVFTEPAYYQPQEALTRKVYEHQRKSATRFWKDWLAKAIEWEIPEPLVDQALRALLIGSAVCIKGQTMCYSLGNWYERLFEAESGDSLRSLLLWGYKDTTRPLVGPLMSYWQQGLEAHDAGFKLQLLSHYYWLTNDEGLVESLRLDWQRETDRILLGREKETGLLPRENYCGDIEIQVYNFSANANAWRGLRDFAAVLADLGQLDESTRLATAAAEYRSAILKALAQSVRTDVRPCFVPVALFGDEEPYERLTETNLGSYWDLMAPYMLGAEVWKPGTAYSQYVLDYLHKRGGICMGLIRFFWNSTDDLYGLRYVLELLKHDEVERSQVSFYGKLAHGFTRDTFIGGEGCLLTPNDQFGRHACLPPNSTSNALFLWHLRYLMVQDWDLDNDGVPDTLRLMFATPPFWLDEGKRISLKKAPTAFGELSVSLESKLEAGLVIGKVSLPVRSPDTVMLRARVPAGWRVYMATIDGREMPVDAEGTVDLSGFSGKLTIVFKVGKSLI